MRRSSTKTSNISSKLGSGNASVIQEIEVAGANDGLRFLTGSSLIAVSAHVRWKYAQNSLTVLSNRHNFSPFIKNRCRWTQWWGQFLDRKQNWRYFCAWAVKKSPKHSKNVFRQKSYSPVTGNLRRRSEWRGQTFDQKLVNRRFCACSVKNRPNSRLLCCKIPQNFSPFMGNRSRWTRRYLNQIKI